MFDTHSSPSSDNESQEIFLPIVVVSAPRTPSFPDQAFTQPTGLLAPSLKPSGGLFKEIRTGAEDLQRSARAREHLERSLKDFDVKNPTPPVSTPQTFKRGHRRCKTTISVSPASEKAARPAFLDPLYIPSPSMGRSSSTPSHPVISLTM